MQHFGAQAEAHICCMDFNDVQQGGKVSTLGVGEMRLILAHITSSTHYVKGNKRANFYPNLASRH